MRPRSDPPGDETFLLNNDFDQEKAPFRPVIGRRLPQQPKPDQHLQGWEWKVESNFRKVESNFRTSSSSSVHHRDLKTSTKKRVSKENSVENMMVCD